MKKLITLEWLSAAGVRAIKTVAQTALAMFTIGQAFSDIAWGTVVSVSIVAGIFSLLTSVVGIPEVGTDGTLKIDTSNPTKETYKLDLTTPLNEVNCKKKITLAVDPKARLS